MEQYENKYINFERQVGRFEITWEREGRRCGFKIYRNGVLVYEDSQGGVRISDLDIPITKIYDLPLPYMV